MVQGDSSNMKWSGDERSVDWRGGAVSPQHKQHAAQLPPKPLPAHGNWGQGALIYVQTAQDSLHHLSMCCLQGHH